MRGQKGLCWLGLGLAGLALLAAGPADAAVTLLHKFAGGANDGRWPYGSLTLSGSTLYGMTFRGGDSDRGVVFSIAGPSVPEAPTGLLLGMGLFGLLLLGRRRRRET